MHSRGGFMRQIPVVAYKDGVRFDLKEAVLVNVDNNKLYRFNYSAYSKKTNVKLDFKFDVELKQFKSMSNSNFRMILSAHVNIQALNEAIPNFITPPYSKRVNVDPE